LIDAPGLTTYPARAISVLRLEAIRSRLNRDDLGTAVALLNDAHAAISVVASFKLADWVEFLVIFFAINLNLLTVPLINIDPLSHFRFLSAPCALSFILI